MLERSKYGVLIFDAVNFLGVNSSNLTYLGLKDYGGKEENKSCHKEYADHAL